jgi:hypothetical protein
MPTWHLLPDPIARRICLAGASTGCDRLDSCFDPDEATVREASAADAMGNSDRNEPHVVALEQRFRPVPDSTASSPSVNK